MKRLFNFILILTIMLLVAAVDSQPNANTNKIVNYLNYADENIYYKSADDYDITVLTKFSYDDNYFHNFVMTDASQLKFYRNNAKNYYLAQNTNILNQIDLSDYNYDISYFSPYVEIIFDDLEDMKIIR